MSFRRILVSMVVGIWVFVVSIALLGSNSHLGSVKVTKVNTPEARIGERLFLETRFAEYFASHSGGDVNRLLAAGDPVVKTIVNPRAGVPYPGPFAGKSINCRSCHFVEEFAGLIGGGIRTYTDFVQRSPMPERDDGRRVTVRNSRNMVDSLMTRSAPLFLHGDGEFVSSATLIKESYAGRNFGWLPGEHRQAIAHIAKVVREDNGSDELGKQYGGSYGTILLGTAPDIKPDFRLPKQYQLDVKVASDEQIVNEVARLVGAYLQTLTYQRNDKGEHTGSAYDRFLEKNNLPRLPAAGESDAQYSLRLSGQIAILKDPKFVEPHERWLNFHDHVFQFGPQELEGLKIFLRRSRGSSKATGVGNCVSCHTAPEFTDYRFHNTGAAQEEYDFVHGKGSFALVSIPSYQQRQRSPNEYLPATPQHPLAKESFRQVAISGDPNATDLGLWNIYGNPDFPEPQKQLSFLLCGKSACDPAAVLPKTVALFRTPTLRDLGQSAPYLHTGRMETVEDVVHYYARSSDLMRGQHLVNGDPQLAKISLSENDIQALAAFLRSLDEDYEN